MQVQSEHSLRRIRQLLFLSLVAATLVCYWRVLVILAKTAYTHEQYSHILLIVPVSLSLIFLERRANSAKILWSPGAGIGLLLSSLLVGWIAQQHPTILGEDITLSTMILAFAMCCVGLVVFSYGVDFVRKSFFAIVFLFFIIPPPQFITDNLIAGLQRASS